MKQIELDYIKHNIIPKFDNNGTNQNIKSIGIFDKSNNLVGEININVIKPVYNEKKLYSFGVLSDVHQNVDKKAFPNTDYKNALNVLKNEGVEFICICGDITEHNTRSNDNLLEVQEYKSLTDEFVNETKIPVYTTTGNHDAGLVSLDRWGKYVYYEKTFELIKHNDHFLFLGMNAYNLGSTGKPYLDKDIAKLKEWLEKYKNERCFVFTHLFFPERAGNFKTVYPSSNWLGGTQLTELLKLNNDYKNVYWFSGHSHWKWYLQKHQKNANIYGKYCGWNIHIPSCASPIDSVYYGPGLGVNGTAWSRDSKYLESEGAIIDVYKNFIEVRGISFAQGEKNSDNSIKYTTKYIPCAQYRLAPGAGNNDSFTNINFNEYDYVTAEQFILNPEKHENTAQEPINLNNGYVEVRFNSSSQGYLIKPTSWGENPYEIVLYVEDVKYFTAPNNNPSNLTKIDYEPNYIGFYGSTDIYGIYSDFVISSVDDPLTLCRAPFQTSSKFIASNEQLNIGVGNKQNQIVIQMKIKIAYSFTNTNKIKD